MEALIAAKIFQNKKKCSTSGYAFPLHPLQMDWQIITLLLYNFKQKSLHLYNVLVKYGTGNNFQARKEQKVFKSDNLECQNLHKLL